LQHTQIGIKIQENAVIPFLRFCPPVANPCAMIKEVIVSEVAHIVTIESGISSFLVNIEIEAAAGLAKIELMA